MDKIQETLKLHQQTAIDKGYNVFCTYLQGSQNYSLDYEGSDIDTKTITIPSIDDIVLNKKPVSTTHVLDDNSHDDQKDIRVMFSTFHKQNINFLEILFTKYYLINPFYEKEIQELFDMADDIANINNNQLLRCIAGMSMEKFKALEHPYPTLIEKLEKFKYDPKQLHHICRLNEFIRRHTSGESFRDCLVTKDRDNLVEIKKGREPLENARIIAEALNNDTYEIKEKFKTEKDVVNKKVIEDLNVLLGKIIKKSFIEELKMNG